MAAASPWTQDQVAEAFRRSPDLKHLLLADVEDTGETLGVGAYGNVKKLRVSKSMLCAGKAIHETLIEHCTKGTEDVVVNFFLECKLMAELRHPHIIQLLGVCMLPSSKLPVLVMELLSDCLHNILDKRANLPLGIKLSILSNVASALVFLHSRSPQILHRDLTAKNVLIDETCMKAKVSDLGNSRFVARPKVGMTRVPGTPDYMPPETQEKDATYCDKLDMFSFGHLSLFTITQVFPDLLGPNTRDKAKRRKPRTEIERRIQYIELMHDSLGREHVFVKIIKQCLQDEPEERPTAMDALQVLEDLNLDADDYEEMHRGQMVDIIQKQNEELVQLKKQMERKMTELNMTTVVKSGPLEKLCPRKIKIVNKSRVWKSYNFKIINNTHLKYFKTWINMQRGSLALSSVDVVVIAPHVSREKYCFEIHFSGNDSPWTLAAYSVAERRSWIKIIRSNQAPKMSRNIVYGLTTFPSGKDKAPKEKEEEPYYEVVEVMDFQSKPVSIQPLLPHRPTHLGKANAPSSNNKRNKETCTQQKQTKMPSDGGKANNETQVDSDRPDYKRMCDTLNRRAPKFTSSQLEHLIEMLQNARCKFEGDEKEEMKCMQAKSERETHQPSTHKARLQFPHHINYEKEAIPERKASLSEEVQSPCDTFPRTGTKSPFYVNYQEFLDRGSERSRPEVPERKKGAHRPRSASPRSRNRHYVNVSSVMESLELVPPPVPKRCRSNLQLNNISEGPSERNSRSPLLGTRVSKSATPNPYLLPVPSTHESQAQTLRRILSDSSSSHKQAPEDLLVTDDGPPKEHIIYPRWARANTSRPGAKTLAAMHRKSLHIKPRALTRGADIGEGRFGMVYKAEIHRGTSSKTVVVKPVGEITAEVWREVSQVVHPNAISLCGLIDEDDMAPAIVMEYLPNGDLKSLLSKNKRSKEQLLKYMIDVAMGMHYLSERGIIHRNLAAHNVLLDENEMCKVADFGLVQDVSQEMNKPSSKDHCRLRWMAPESLSEGVFSTASDIWSYGILQWEMFNPHKLYPYPTFQNDEVMEKVIGGFLMPVPRNVPQMVIHIMKACWKTDPHLRPSFLLISKLLTEQIIGKD